MTLSRLSPLFSQHPRDSRTFSTHPLVFSPKVNTRRPCVCLLSTDAATAPNKQAAAQCLIRQSGASRIAGTAAVTEAVETQQQCRTLVSTLVRMSLTPQSMSTSFSRLINERRRLVAFHAAPQTRNRQFATHRC